MINVKILKNSKTDYVGFEISGHAGYADPGFDIVCSAVSALSITTVNSIEKLCEDDFSFEADQKKGDMKLLAKANDVSHDMQLILKSFEIGITDMAEAYDDYICLTFKEV